METCRAVPYPLNRQLACNMFPSEIFGMSHFFYSFPGKAEKERRSESIRSLANYERRFKRHVSLYVHLFIACIKFQFCRIHPFVVAYIILKNGHSCCHLPQQILLMSSIYMLHVSAVLTIVWHLNTST